MDATKRSYLLQQLVLYEDMLLRERILLNAVDDIFRNPNAGNINILKDKKRRSIRISDLERKINEIKVLINIY